jgi:hypothetical protein
MKVVLLNQIPHLVCDIAGCGADVTGDRANARCYIAGDVFARFVNPRGMFAEVIAGVFEIVTCILQVTFKLFASLFTGLRCINKSCGRASGYPEGENCPVANYAHDDPPFTNTK